SIPLLPIPVQDGNSQQEEIDFITKTDDVLPSSDENNDDLSNDLLLGEADLFLVSDNSIPPVIKNVADNPEGDIHFLEELIIDDSILSDELSDANFEENPSIPRPPPEPPKDYPPEIEVILCRIYVRFPRSSYPLIDFSLGRRNVDNSSYHALAYAKNILIASILATEAKDSSKSNPSSCRYPLDGTLSRQEEILEFLRFLGHSAQIKTLTDVNVNKLYQPWRSFAAVINKCLTGKSTGFNSLRLSQAQILWGLYYRRYVDYAFLIWEDFMYQVEHKNQKKSNVMYYSRFTKVIIHHFMTRKPSIPKRNKVNWHYVRDDILFSTIKVVSRHQNTQQYGAILTIELTTEDIRNTKAYKEYYACATGEAAPKPKASTRRKIGGSVSFTTPPTPITTLTPLAAPRLTAAAKGKQPVRATSPTEPTYVKRTEAEQLKIVLRRSRHETHISQQGGSSTDEGTSSIQRVPDVPSDDLEEEISWNFSDDEDVDDQTKGSDDKEGEKTDESDDDDDDDDQDEAKKVNDDDDDEEEISKIDEQEAIESGEGNDEETESDGESEEEETIEKEEQSFDPIPRTPEKSEDDGNGEEDQGVRISEEERMQEEEEADELYRDVDINQGRGLQVSQDIEDSHVTLTPTHSDGQQERMESIFTTGSSSVTPIPSPKSTMTPSIVATTTTASPPSIPPTAIPSDILQTLLTFTLVFRFKDRVKSLEDNFSELMRTNQSPEAVSNIPAITTRSGVAYEGPSIPPTSSSLLKKVEREPEVTREKVQTTNLRSTAHVQPLKLSLPDLTPTRMTLELATRSIAYPAGITKDVFVQVGKFKFPTEFVVVDYDVDPRVPLILGRPFLRTAHALVNKLNHPSSGSTTPLSNSSPNLTHFETSDSLLEEFADELALLDPFPSGNKDDNFDFKADHRKIEYLLNQDPSTESHIEILDPILEKFTDEPALDYLPPPRDDDDDLFDLKSDSDEWKKILYGDCYKDIDSEKEENKDSKMKLLVVEDHIIESNHLLP
nr:reverse transcriptase domain-containing protein [Tanacetum cinerariifolium]